MPAKHTQTCAIAGFLNVFGDAWALLIIREAFYGATRFTEFQKNTGIAKNLLSERLTMLVDEGVLDRVNVGEKGSRFSYELTKKGKSLVPVLVAMIQWSNAFVFGPGNEPIHLIERASGKPLEKMVPKSGQSEELGWEEIVAQAGPGSNQAARLRIAQSHNRSHSQ